MSSFLLGMMIAGIVGGSIAYNCYAKREVIEKTLRHSIQNLEYNITMVKKEAQLRLDQMDLELKKTKESSRKTFTDLEQLTAKYGLVKSELDECQRRLRED